MRWPQSTVWLIRRDLRLALTVSCFLFAGSFSASTVAQQSPTSDPSDAAESAASDANRVNAANTTSATPADALPLRFSFESTPWRSVLAWLADEAGLALHLGDVPAGSFTYSDPSEYAPNEAISRVNLFLIPQGFSLVRSGNLLSLISLEDPRSFQQLESMAEFVASDELSTRGPHDVVRCLFPLGSADADAVIRELSGISLMTPPQVLPETRQLLITDTAGKLRDVARLLKPLEQLPDGDDTVQRFELEHLTVEEVLSVVRPHLGLQPEEMVGLDISLSADAESNTLFVSGAEPTVKLLQSLITVIDVSGPSSQIRGGQVLQSHEIRGENLTAVFDVLQTVLAGQSIRLSMEPASNSIVAFATPEVHEKILQTIAELEAPATEFEVLQLSTVDPYFVISLLREMFNLPDEFADPATIDPNGLKVDADVGNRRLFIRGRAAEIAQVKEVVARLDQGLSPRSDLRLLPMHGRAAEQMLETAERFWRGDAPVIVYPTTDGRVGEAIERAINVDGSELERPESPSLPGERPDSAVDAANATADITAERAGDASVSLISESAHRSGAVGADAAGVIKTQVTPRGLLIQSDDPAAVDAFEEHLQQIAGAADAVASPPVVYYLKYVTANDATRMLADLLDGASSAFESGGSSMAGGLVSASLDGLGSLVWDREGATTMTAGTATVVADARLNRLIVQGTSQDIAVIDSYLKIIDKDRGITSVETYGQSRMIELVHTRATDVAEVIRGVYAGRIAEDTSRSRGSRGEQRDSRDSRDSRNDNNSRDDRDQDDESGRSFSDSSDRNRRGSRDQEPPKPARSREPQMTLAVHEQSNALVVAAPDQLFREVEQLARSIDAESAQSIQVLTPRNPDAIREVLAGLVGGEPAPDNANRETSRSRENRNPRSER